MSRMLFPFAFLATPAVADPSLQHRPQGVDPAWIAAVRAGMSGGVVTVRPWNSK